MGKSKPFAQNVITEDKYDNAIIIGRILKTWREKMGIMQKDVAQELSYRNANYISMFEQGRTSIPLGRIADIVKAYKIDPRFGLSILRALYPEFFKMMFDLVSMTTAKSFDDASDQAEDVASEIVERFNIPLEIKKPAS